jgi:hypothetical protein
LEDSYLLDIDENDWVRRKEEAAQEKNPNRGREITDHLRDR